MKLLNKKFNKYKALLLLFFSFSVQAQDAITSHKSSELPLEGFAKQSNLKCDQHEIFITTSCVEREKDLPYCFNQSISFLKANGDVESSTKFDYQFLDGNQEFITEASCVNLKNSKVVVLEKTNFGNCEICEWVDVFSSDGKYIGSSKNIYEKLHSYEKRISPIILETLRKKLNGNAANMHVDIYRNQ